ncbi:MAG TPA: cytochrome c biogenesis protein CcsA [Pirellulaceae bacterium]|nr:cytochrome c biogenesis protein CcsA [Pirellulaceae bacterium]
MAAGTFESTEKLAPAAAARTRTRARTDNPFVLAVEALTSLKLTVVLFAYGIFVVLVGTLAQTEMDIWQVVPLYFRSWIMRLDVNLFFPPSFFPEMPHFNVPLIPLPGGMLVGVLMLANLTAAHLWRFQMQARGQRLWTGLGVLAAGVALTTAIIVSGNLGTGVQAKPFLSPGQIWAVFLGILFAGWLAATYFFGRYALQEWTAMFRDSALFWFRLRLLSLFGSGYVALTALVGLMFSGILEPPTESMRILWQLLQGTAAGAVLLAGCWLLFQKRAGIVLLHAGVVLMMVNELVVARYAIEWQMTLEEGEAANFARDIRTTELAIIDRSQPDAEQVTVIPRELLEKNAAANENLAKENKPPQPIRDDAGRHELLPFDVTVLAHYRNHNVRALRAGQQSLATKGVGTELVADPARSAKGTDSNADIDVGAIYARLTEKKTGRDLGTYLISQAGEEGVVEIRGLAPEQFREVVEVGGQKYQLLLRFERQYKPYTVKLIDVRKDDYLGSDTPKNYSSDVRLVDPETNIDNKIHIKMNDPLRYRGDTFYQSGYARQPHGSEVTTLAVVSNVGWMIPYLACMIVATGMIFQFGLALDRFLNRRSQEEALARAPIKPGMAPAGIKGAVRHAAADGRPLPLWDGSRASLIAVALAALFAIGYIGSKLREPKVADNEMNLVEMGKLPIVQTGRVKPLDTLARNGLRAMSNYEEVKFGKDGEEIEVSAMAWLLDSVTGQEKAFEYRVIKIDSPDLHKLFDLKRQPRHLYALSQIAAHHGEIRKMAIAAHQKQEKDPESVTALDRNALALDEKLRLYNALMVSFNPPMLPPLPSEQQVNEDPAAAKRMVDEFRLKLMDIPQEMKALGVPLIVPSKGKESAESGWLPYPTAWVAAYIQARIMGEEPDAATQKLETLLNAYRQSEPAAFNKALVAYRAEVARIAPKDYNADKVRRESYFNHLSPFYLGAVLYVVALVLALVGWLVQAKPLHLAALTMIGITFLFHTAALIERIYISGRPPVTNLYSSAIFIGWGCVLFCLVLEGIYRNGLGNVVGSVTGFAALVISYLLAAGGDTIAVLQAVLDTQFWLATHVVLITLGYTATFVAGFCGLCYLLSGICTPNLSDKLRSELARMIYGVTCFAIILSFVGTVLGGLWADDSWGRFWGWDPKENGALMIVMWNALVLHARWDKLVKDRGLALLAIGGNVITAWSWFGVNELGIGLHSYGFTDGVLRALGTFCLYMLCCVVFGAVPLRMWWSDPKGNVSWGTLVTAVVGLAMAAAMLPLAWFIGKEDPYLPYVWLVVSASLLGMSVTAIAGYVRSRQVPEEKPAAATPISLSLAVNFGLLNLAFIWAFGYYVCDYYDLFV